MVALGRILITGEYDDDDPFEPDDLMGHEIKVTGEECDHDPLYEPYEYFDDNCDYEITCEPVNYVTDWCYPYSC